MQVRLICGRSDEPGVLGQAVPPGGAGRGPAGRASEAAGDEQAGGAQSSVSPSASRGTGQRWVGRAGGEDRGGGGDGGGGGNEDEAAAGGEGRGADESRLLGTQLAENSLCQLSGLCSNRKRRGKH